MELDAEFNEIACISYFKILTLASETSICARTAEINCRYFMTLFVLRTRIAYLLHAEVDTLTIFSKLS